MRPCRAITIALSGLLILGVAGCGEAPSPVRPPVERPEPPLPPPPPALKVEHAAAPMPSAEPAAPLAPSAESVALRQYYLRLQEDLLAQGLLREDEAEDASITAAVLARNFINIALYDEYPPESDIQASAPQASALRRWGQPIRMQMVFGPSVSAEQAAQARSEIEAYAARLSRLTGVPIVQVNGAGNFHVAVLNEDERRSFGPQLKDLVPGITDSSVRSFTNVPIPILCLVLAFGSGERSGYSQAVALIRAEHPDLLRTACIHEELAQGMGLANDSPAARPSIFNDSEEFARLTRHDELLLRILYDPRLELGMTIDEATPLVKQIAAELVVGPA